MMKKNSILEKRRACISKETQVAIDFSFEIVDRIHEILESKGMSQKDLATMLGKNESEISKWMRGTHNFTIFTIKKIEQVLGCSILSVQKQEATNIYLIMPNTSSYTSYSLSKKESCEIAFASNELKTVYNGN